MNSPRPVGERAQLAKIGVDGGGHGSDQKGWLRTEGLDCVGDGVELAGGYRGGRHVCGGVYDFFFLRCEGIVG